MPDHIEACGYNPSIKDGKPNKECGEKPQGGRVLAGVGLLHEWAQMNLLAETPPRAREGAQRLGCEDLFSPAQYTAC